MSETKTTNEYKGIELLSDLIKHNAKDNKMVIQFNLNDTTYKNATLVPVGASEEQHNRVFEALMEWAKTTINENIKS